MADRPTTSASRVGRPRMRSVHQIPCVPSSKVGGTRSKSVHKSKVKDSATKNPTKQTVRPILQLEQDVVVIDPEDQEFLFPADQLPDLPPIDLEQGPNNNPQLNPLNQPLDLPAEEVDLPNPPLNQQNQPQDLPADQPNQQNPPTGQPNQVNPPNQPPNLLVNPPNPMANQQQLNWSYFKPEYSGKEEEDLEAHLLRTNDWMETHNFPDDTKVRIFCLTLMGEARLWYETLRAVQLDWDDLQKHF